MQCWALSLSVAAAVGLQQAVDPGDIIFTKSDLHRKRYVMVHPGQRVVLVDEWPGKRKKNAKKMPNVIHAEPVPLDRRGEFELPWLPNVTVQVVHHTDLSKPRSKDVDEDLVERLEQIFSEALVPGQSDIDAQEYVLRLRTELSEAIGGDCIDDPILNAAGERRMRAVVFVFSDRRKLSWAVTHMFEDAYLEGNELMLGDLHTKDLGFDLRMHVWNDWTTRRNITWFHSMTHCHGQTTITASQVVGNLQSHIFQTGGEFYGDGGMDPILMRTDEGPNVEMKRVEVEGVTATNEVGQTYMFPTRWIHTALMPSMDSISIEVRKALFGKKCEDNNPPRIRVLDHWKKPELFTDMMYFRWPELRRKVASYLGGTLEGLDEEGYKYGSLAFRDILDGPHLDLTPEEQRQVDKTQRFYEGTRVRLTSSRKNLLKAFKTAPPRHKYDERTDSMLGHVFKVWKQLSDRMVSLIDPADGLGIGISITEPFYFPPSVLKVVVDGQEL